MNKKIIGLGSLAVVLSLFGLSAANIQAYRGDPGVPGPNCSPERHEAMQEAFTNGDYNAWAALMQDRSRVTQVVNQDNFAKFAEAHSLALQGKKAEAQQIRQELGLGLRNGSGWQNGGNR